MKRINYSTIRYPFASIYGELLGIFNLQFTHEHTLNTYKEIFSREKDQSSVFHKLYYDNFQSKFSSVYTEFLQEHIAPLYNEPIVYQQIPTFRIHLPGNIAVGEFHKDKWYRDPDWHQAVNELNYYLPLTDTYDTNTIWVESVEDKGDYQPMNMKYGECMQWDGVNLMHGNKQNSTPHTRISVDFRIMSYSKYIPSAHGSINMGKKFEIGGYYNILK